MPTDEEERPRDKPLLALSVLGICFSGFLLQLLTFIYLFQGLCNKVPEDRAYCNSSADSLQNSNDTTDPEGVLYYGGYQACIGVALFIDLFAIIKVTCRMYCCVKNCWIHISITVWEMCHCCGNCWYIMAGLSVILNLLGIISVCTTVPFGDLIDYMVGFRIGFANLLLGSIKIALWTGYSIYRGSCCPNTDYFLGSSRRLSECIITKTTITTRVTETRRPDGTVQVDRQEVDRATDTRRVAPI